MTRGRTITLVLCVTVALFVALTASQTRGHVQSSRPDHFSIVPMDPDAKAALKAQGRALKFPFPNSVNQGRKFNPVGDRIESLVTDPEQNVLVIFVRFTDNPPGGPATRLNMSYFDDMLFGTTYDPPEYAGYPGHPTDRTLVNYYAEVSYGNVHVVTLNMPSAQGWTDVGHPYSYYCNNDNGFGWYPNNAQGLVADAVKLLDPVIDFSKYAIDGEVPNLFVVHAGTGAEWSGDPALIWSHSWSLPAPYTTDDGVIIDNYAMMPEVGGNLTGYYGAVSGPFPPTVGVFAHEYGHVLGLPDQYDYGYESDGTDVYSLMAGGSWNRYPNAQIFSGNSPAHLDAWSKYRLGFVVPMTVASASAVLPPAETDPVVYRMEVPNSNGLEYFLFENRQQIGFDQGLARFYTHGLAIYHVDDTVFTRNYWRPNEAENWKEFRSEGWRKAWTGETHYAISLVQADDRWDLERAFYYPGPTGSLSGDLYPGRLGITKFGSNTKPNSSNYYYWAGSTPKFGYSGVTAGNIKETNGVITVDLSYEPWSSGK